jgi:hypothetical protein
MSRGCGGKCERRRATASTSPEAASPAQNIKLKIFLKDFTIRSASIKPRTVLQFIFFSFTSKSIIIIINGADILKAK